MKQALGISVDKPQRAACVKNQHGLAQQVRHGLQFLQQATQTHLFGDGLGCGYDQAKVWWWNLSRSTARVSPPTSVPFLPKIGAAAQDQQSKRRL